jgi:hypothetical protein
MMPRFRAELKSAISLYPYGAAHLRLRLVIASAIPGSSLGTVPSSFRRVASL